MRPRLLCPNNFAPAACTPWGGRKILEHYKRGLDLGAAASTPLCGESWEVSVESSLPSRFADDDELLSRAIAGAPDTWLGSEAAARGQRQTPLLIKLLDARDMLSVQVHPRHDDPELAAREGGKTESWYVLDTDGSCDGDRDRAGMYLGFRDGVGRAEVEQCLRLGGRLDELMNFVPVAPGDAFVIEPGTVHAIAAGVTLLEPQAVSPGLSGMTYRYWDWNRRYDARGVPSPDGRPRQLHIRRSLEVTAWDAPRGDAFVASCQAESVALTTGSLGRTRIVATSQFIVERWAGRGVLSLPAQGALVALVCVAGAAELQSDAGTSVIRRGQSAVIPAAAGAIKVTSVHRQPDVDSDDAEVVLLATREAGS